MNIHIITDSASDIVGNQRGDLTILPMTITFGETQYQDGVNLSHRDFYEKLIEGDTLPVTSQIPPYDFEQAIQKATQNGDPVIVITLSSKLSGTWQSACIAADNCNGTVYVIDSENVAVGERVLVDYALHLKDGGMDAEAIVEELNRAKKDIRLIALLDTLEYLQKGGRISKTAAFAGGLLSIKPVVAIENGEVVILGKARGSKQANNLIAQQVSASGIDFSKPYCLGYTGLSDELIKKYIADNSELWQAYAQELPVRTVGGTIGTHAGPGAIAAAWFALSRSQE